MGNYTFRVRFERSPRDTINIEADSLSVDVPSSSRSVTLTAREDDKSIKDAQEWVLKSEGWTSEEAALQAGEEFQNALWLTLARLRVGADFGRRAPKGFMTTAGLSMIEEETGRRVLNDKHGLMAYQTEPRPLFVKAQVDYLRGVPHDKFVSAFSAALHDPPLFSKREKLSYELFFASFFQDSADVRFLLLVMAVEALVDSQPRSDEAIKHVEQLIDLTCNNEALLDSEKDSILGSLSWLRKQSIGQATRTLIRDHLGSRSYGGESAQSFFTTCYTTRSRLVHGEPPLPTIQEVGSLAAPLEELVSDLLSGDLLEVEL